MQDKMQVSFNILKVMDGKLDQVDTFDFNRLSSTIIDLPDFSDKCRVTKDGTGYLDNQSEDTFDLQKVYDYLETLVIDNKKVVDDIYKVLIGFNRENEIETLLEESKKEEDFYTSSSFLATSYRSDEAFHLGLNLERLESMKIFIHKSTNNNLLSDNFVGQIKIL